MIGIYKITSPSGKIYIGQSVNIEKRWRTYKRLNCKLQKHLYSSLLKYGIENHSFEVITTCDQKDLNKYEKYYMDEYGLFNTNKTLNIRDGGGSRAKFSEESRLKMSILRKGKYSGENNPMNKPGVREKCLGRICSEETRFKIGKANEISKSIGAVLQFSLDNKLICEYTSAMMAGKITGINNRNISLVCKNKRKTAGGYIWKYKEKNQESLLILSE